MQCKAKFSVAVVGAMILLVGSCNMPSFNRATDFYVSPDSTGQTILFSDKSQTIWVVSMVPSIHVTAAKGAPKGRQYDIVAASPDGQLFAVTETTHQSIVVTILDKSLRQAAKKWTLPNASVLEWMDNETVIVVLGSAYGLHGGPLGKYRLSNSKRMEWRLREGILKPWASPRSPGYQSAILHDKTYTIDYVDASQGFKTTVYEARGTQSKYKRVSSINGASYSGIWALKAKGTLLVQRETSGSSSSGLYELDPRAQTEVEVLGPVVLRKLRDAALGKAVGER